jgi:hypothetical protein
MDPEKMTRQCKITIHPTTAKDDAIQEANSLPKHNITIIHVGTSNLRRDSPQETADKIIRAARILQQKGSQVIISRILPREGIHLHNKVEETNFILEQSLTNATFTSNKTFCYQQ